VRHGNPTLIAVTLRWTAPNFVLEAKDTVNSRAVADGRGRKRDFATVSSRSHENRSCLKTGKQAKNNNAGLLEEGEMEQVGRLI
jgi:hypothetical protein